MWPEHLLPSTLHHDIIDVMMERGDTVYEILRAVRPMVLNSARVVEAEVRDLGWTVGSRAVMEVLLDGAPMTVPQAASRLSLARQNVQRHVDELIKLGHVESKPNPAHRRSVLIQPTEKGSRAFTGLHDRERAQLALLAPQCSEQDLRTTIRVLGDLNHDIKARAAASAAGTRT